ncbi:rho GTPase-activating protein SYDE2 [Pelodytes ibericus]
MADPLRRTLSKLRGKRAKKEWNGEGSVVGCNGGSCVGYRTGATEAFNVSRVGVPEVCIEDRLQGYSTGNAMACNKDIIWGCSAWESAFRATEGMNVGGGCGSSAGATDIGNGGYSWGYRAETGLSSQNHNNNNYSYSMGRGAEDPVPDRVSSWYSNNVNGDEEGYPATMSCNVTGQVGKYGNCYHQYSTTSVSPLNSPASAPYTSSPNVEGEWIPPPHSAPFPSCSMTFVFPQHAPGRGPQEPCIGVGTCESAYSYPGVLGGGEAVTSEFHVPSLEYSDMVRGPFFGSSENQSEDSEEDDYYDNGNLLIWGTVDTQCDNVFLSPSPTPMHRTMPSQPAGSQQRIDGVNIYLETDRLRSQLQEAYYLLINAMHDMPLGKQTDNIVHAAERRPSNSLSQDSVCSQSSLRARESDVWSSDESSLRQVSNSDLVALQFLGKSKISRLRVLSKSLDAIYNFASPGLETLHKCPSDGLLKYSSCNSQSSCDYSSECSQDSEGSASPQTLHCPTKWGDSQSTSQPDPVHQIPSDRGQDSSANSQKQTGRTVRKMQKWMYKGRLLSLEMKERIIGSSQRAGSSCKPLSNRVVGSRCEPQANSDISQMLPGETTRPPLTDLIENVYASSVIQRDLKVTEVNEQNLQKNRITVSKKRNWLTQSTHKFPHRSVSFTSTRTERNNAYSLVAKEYPHQTLTIRTESINKSNEISPQSPASPSPSSVGASQLGEENDADDEGEIWYNPIPEDDDPFSSDGKISLQAVCVGENLQMSNPADSTHSTDSDPQAHKHRALCRTQMGQNAEAIPHKPNEAGVQSVNKANSTAVAAEFSPPSSPNPLKKGGSISWSLPDKIKSPRTVRKLSMKMKKLPELSRKLSVRGTSNNVTCDPAATSSKAKDISHSPSLSSSTNTSAASRNVISRYHLDSSVSSQQNYRKKRSASSKSSSKGGYLSDGDSPELIAKSGKHGPENSAAKGKEVLPGSNVKSEIDIDAFRHYSFSDQPKCFQYVSGLMSAHFYGAEDLKPPRIDSKDVFCAIQVDCINKARTALLTCRTTFLDMDHTFNIELENAQHLKLVVFSWDPAPRKNRVCCHGTVVLPSLFRVIKTHQLAVKLEPRGMIYVKLSLMEQWDNSLDRLGVDREPVIFGVDARKVVEKENMGLKVPLLMEKCIMEIEKRGCQVVGLYRLCGSAAVKKELREAFERDSKAVGLCENEYPDINVITGVLKDYLRELPSPLISKQLYEAVITAMAARPLRMTINGCDNDSRDMEETVDLLACLPDVERATLKMLLDHLKLVASYNEVNKMTCQNLAVCFGPVLLSQRQETSAHNKRVFIDSEELASALDFKKHIEVLHYLLQLWPVKSASAKDPAPSSPASEGQPCLRRKKPRPQMLNLNSSDASGVLRQRIARLDSPSSNRYAGDWSSCRENYFTSLRREDVDCENVTLEDTVIRTHTDNVRQQIIAKEQSLAEFLNTHGREGSEEAGVNLHDLQESIDTLLGNLERELNKNKLNANF